MKVGEVFVVEKFVLESAKLKKVQAKLFDFKCSCEDEKKRKCEEV